MGSGLSMPVIPTRDLPETMDGTSTIAVTFVFLAYFLHPRVEEAFHQIKAYRAWRALENEQTVEVTHYPLRSEILSGRGKWDTARMIAVILIGFAVASWVLELSLGLADVTDGPVDMMDRPPPVLLWNDTEALSLASWKVRSGSIDGVDSDGTLGNFKGTFEAGNSTSRYRIGTKWHVGSILTAWWSDDHLTASSGLSYDANGTGIALVTALSCTTDTSEGEVFIDYEDDDDSAEESWGSVKECANGPQMVGDTNGASSPPTIILQDSSGATHLIVEEDSNYPSFLYSVWAPSTSSSSQDDVDSNQIEHVFHIASKSRLVEAIVTGIVNGILTGGGCMDLLLQFSEDHAGYVLYGQTRASPFGEHPGNSTSVTDLSEVEPIELGVSLKGRAFVCFLLVVVLSALSIGLSFCLRNRIGMDVYNRDELIKAVSLPGHTAGTDGAGSPPSTMRMFVRKDDAGAIDVVINEIPIDPRKFGSCTRFFRRTFSHKVFDGCLARCCLDDAVACHHDERRAGSAIADESGRNGTDAEDMAVESARRVIRLEGMGLARVGKGRSWGTGSGSTKLSENGRTNSQRRNRSRNRSKDRFAPDQAGSRSVSLTASPVVSRTGTPVQGSPAHGHGSTGNGTQDPRAYFNAPTRAQQIARAQLERMDDSISTSLSAESSSNLNPAGDARSTFSASSSTRFSGSAQIGPALSRATPAGSSANQAPPGGPSESCSHVASARLSVGTMKRSPARDEASSGDAASGTATIPAPNPEHRTSAAPNPGTVPGRKPKTRTVPRTTASGKSPVSSANEIAAKE